MTSSSTNAPTQYFLNTPNLFDNIDLFYSKIRSNPAGGKVVNCLPPNKQPFIVVTPTMLQWGPQEGKDSSGQLNGKWTVSFQFPTEDYATPELAVALENLKALETKIRRDAIHHSVEWFGKQITSQEVMDEKFNDMLRYPRIEKGSPNPDYSRPPCLSLKLPRWGKEKKVWKTDVFQSENVDEDGNLVPVFTEHDSDMHDPMEFIPKKVNAIAVAQMGGLWFVNGKVSITWNLMQIILQTPPVPIHTPGVCMLGNSTIAKLNASAEDAVPTTEATTEEEEVSCTVVDDSDDESTLPTEVVEEVVTKKGKKGKK